MIPTQKRSVDPHSSYWSDNVNRITRILTAGDNKIARDTDLFCSYNTNTTVFITSGIAVKDDVMIHVENNITFDLTNPDNYIIENVGDPQEMEGPFAPYDFGYLVLSYQYVKHPTPNVAEIKVLKNRSDFDENLYIFLAMLEFTGPTEIHSLGVKQSDPSPPAPIPGPVIRPVANLNDAYTDQKARDAQALNPISNHLPVLVADRDKLLLTDENTGLVTFITKDSMGLPHQEFYTAPDYNGSNQLIIDHNLGRYPIVQVIETSSKLLMVEANVHHPTMNTMIITFDETDYTPEIIVRYE